MQGLILKGKSQFLMYPEKKEQGEGWVVTEKGCPGMHLEATCRRPGADGTPQAVVLLLHVCGQLDGHEVLLPGGQQLVVQMV